MARMTGAEYTEKMKEFDAMIEKERLDIQRLNRVQYTDSGFSTEELQKAFNMVCDVDNWKNPINATIHCSLVEITLAAIEFMTGTKGTIAGVASNSKRLIVTAPGYYAGPCN